MLTHRRGWLVGAMALVAMLAVLWMSRDGWGEVPAAPPVAVPPASASGFARGAGAAVDPAAGLPERERAQAGRLEQVDGTPLELRVLVLLPDGRPAAGAEVWYWPPRSPAQRERDDETLNRTRDLEVALRGSGRMVLADVEGRAAIATETVDVGEMSARLCARLGRFYAEEDLGGVPEPIAPERKLCLVDDVTLRVLVVDGDGRPCEGVDIEAQVQFRSRRVGSDDQRYPLGATDAQGLVALPHAQVELPTPRAEFLTWQMRLGCAQKVMSAGERQVSAAELLSPEPIRLVVRAGGTIVARIVDADGAPWTDPTTHLRGIGTKGRLTGSLHLADPAHYLFHQVPLGQRWRLHSGGHSMVVVGPVRSDEVVEARLVVPVRQWSLVGRLVCSDGELLPRASLALRGTDPDVQTAIAHGQDGELQIGWSLPAAVERLAGLELEVDHGRFAGRPRIALGTLRPGRNEVGELVVPVPADEVLLASVELRCEGRALAGGDAWLLARDRGDGRRVPAAAKRQGAVLSLRGRSPQVPMDLVCAHPECVDSLPIAIGLGEHRVVELRRAALLRVQVDAPTIPFEMIWADLAAVDGGETSGYIAGATFCWLPMVPGRYRLRIGTKDRVLYEAASIELAPGLNRWPADGAPIDLRGVQGAVRLDVRSADRHEEVETFDSYAVPAGATGVEGVDLPPMENLRDWFVPRREPMDVLIAAPGFVPVRLANPTTDMVVRLERCTELRVGGAAVGKGRVVRVSIVQHVVVDRLLRAADASAQYRPFEASDPGEPIELFYAPGTIVEVVVERGGVAGEGQRVVVGAGSPQEVVVR